MVEACADCPRRQGRRKISLLLLYDYWAACDKVNRNIGFVVSVAKLMAARKQRTGQREHHENRLRLQAVKPDAPRWSTHGAERTKVLWLLPAQCLAKTWRVNFCWQRRSCAWIPHFSIFIKSSIIEEATYPRGFSFSLFFQILNIEVDAKLSKIYCSPQWYWKVLAAGPKISEDVAKKLLIKQTLWQINLTAPKHIPRPKFDVCTPNAVHQADLFLPHDNQDKSLS